MCSVNCAWFIISCISPVRRNHSVIIASFAQNKTLLITAQREPLEHSQLYTGSIKKDNRAWVTARALLLEASPTHSLAWGVVDGNQTQWKAYHPLQHPCHNLIKVTSPPLIMFTEADIHFKYARIVHCWLFVLKLATLCRCVWLLAKLPWKICTKGSGLSTSEPRVFSLAAALEAPFQRGARDHSRAGTSCSEAPGNSRTRYPELVASPSSSLWSTTDWTPAGNHRAGERKERKKERWLELQYHELFHVTANRQPSH